MRTFPNRSQMAANAARQQNPAWPWIVGGAVAAAGVGAYFCWPRRVSTDSVNITHPNGHKIEVSRTIDFKGCAAQMPYDVTITIPETEYTNATTIVRSFRTLEEAQAYNPDQEAPTPQTQQPPRQANPHPAHLTPPRFSMSSAPTPRPVPSALQRNPLVTIFSPATYSYPSAPYLYPQIAHGGYGTAMLV